MNLFEQFLVQKNWLQTKILELLVLDVQLILCRLLPRVSNVTQFDASLLLDHLGDVANTPSLRNLVQNHDSITLLWRIFHCELQASSSVLDVDESASLSTRAVDGQRNTQSRLHEESVQHSSIVSIIVEAVDQSLIFDSLRCVRTPDDALMQVCNANAVIFVVKLEQQRIKALGSVVD